MSTPIKDGGPAFPDPGIYEDSRQGMSLRDWFAGMAMQGIKANDALLKRIMDCTDMPLQDAIALMAYKDADAMLVAREKGQS